MNCRFCGITLPEAAVFCGECGRAVPIAASTAATPRRRAAMPSVTPAPAASLLAFSSEPDAEPIPRLMIHVAESGFNCPQCGEQISPVDVFCGECGFVLSGSALVAGAVDARDTAVIEPLPDDGGDDTASQDVVANEIDGADEIADPIQDAGRGDHGEHTEMVDSDSIAKPGSTDVVVDPVVSFFAPRSQPRPAPTADESSEAIPEPIPLVEPLPFREPVVANPVSEPNVASATPKVLRKVPDPFPWGKGQGTVGIDLEATRAVASTVAEERFVLQFSTGESVTVSGAGLVGRNPASQPGEFVDQLVTIFDAGKSVSKTHLEFGQDSGRFWVSDRYSTNGSTIRQPDAEPKRCDPGRRYFIARGTRVDIGEQFFVVS
jgi:hypothetical protein